MWLNLQLLEEAFVLSAKQKFLWCHVFLRNPVLLDERMHAKLYREKLLTNQQALCLVAKQSLVSVDPILLPELTL